jgi:hypothetical protein
MPYYFLLSFFANALSKDSGFASLLPLTLTILVRIGSICYLEELPNEKPEAIDDLGAAGLGFDGDTGGGRGHGGWAAMAGSAGQGKICG